MALELPKYQCTMRFENCTAERKHCDGCGFERREAQRRKKIPLTESKDGYWRMVINKSARRWEDD